MNSFAFEARRSILAIYLALLLAVTLGISDTSRALGNQTRIVGLAYSTLVTSATWQHSWGTPLIGNYISNNINAIRKHAEWIAESGVDFIFIDWSNDLSYSPGCNCRPDVRQIEDATYTVFDTYNVLTERPKIAIMIGFPTDPTAILDGSLQRKADQVYRDFVQDPERANLYEYYIGKPLLIVYTGTPSPYQHSLPPWTDQRFTVRWMTGYVSDQPALLGGDRVSKFGYWSWEDRGPQTYTYDRGRPEAMTVVAAWRGDASQHISGRTKNNGITFKKEWERAREKDVSLALVVSWNSWVTSEEPNAEAGKDLEPSLEFGEFYLNLLRNEIAQFKGR